MRISRNPALLALVLGMALVLAVPEQSYAGKKSGGPVQIGQDVNKKSKSGDKDGRFPIVISEPGSYVLITNLDLRPAPEAEVAPDLTISAIEITADHVTLDLGGFSIIGPVTCAGSPVTSCDPAAEENPGSGVDACPMGFCARHTTVTNGAVHGMPGAGLKLGDGAHVEKVTAGENGADGIGAGANAVVTHCMAERNGSNGVTVGNNSQVTGNTATGNGARGISVGDGCKVLGNVSSGNEDGLFMGNNTGFGDNILTGNSNSELKVAPLSEAFELGQNVCGNSINCP